MSTEELHIALPEAPPSEPCDGPLGYLPGVALLICCALVGLWALADASFLPLFALVALMTATWGFVFWVRTADAATVARLARFFPPRLLGFAPVVTLEAQPPAVAPSH